MPTHHKPSLSHKRFNWKEANEIISPYLESKADDLLKVIGFWEEYGNPDKETRLDSDLFKKEGRPIIERITGTLLKAGAILVDAGFKSNRSVIATIRSIKAKPEILLGGNQEQVEPEAEGLIAKFYTRSDDEQPGQYWFLVTEGGADLDRIRLAADKAIIHLLKQGRKGRPRDIAKETLVSELRETFLRFNDRIDRKVPGYSKENPETGCFKEFLALVLPPLETVLSSYPSLAERATRKRSKKQSRISVFSLDELVRSAKNPPNKLTKPWAQ